MKCAGSLLVVSALIMAGCSTAPVQTPRATSAFSRPDAIASTPAAQAHNAASKFFLNAYLKAERSDAASDFQMKANGLSIFAVALAAGGALTGSKSKLYKTAGALLGLGMGANQYFKPKDQRTIYFNSAEAAYCSGIHMTTLAQHLTGIDIKTISKAKEKVRSNSVEIKQAIYSQNLSSLPVLQSASIVTAAINSDADATAQLAALNFIASPYLQAHNRNLLLLKYELSEINKTAFNIDDTLGTIAKLSVSPADALNALDTLKQPTDITTVPGTKNETSKKPTEEEKVTSLLILLPEIIQTISDFSACTNVLKPVTTGT